MSQATTGPLTAPHAAPEPRAREGSDCRCLCGSLVARVRPEGVELKCRRCKRVLIVPLAPGDGPGDGELRPVREIG